MPKNKINDAIPNLDDSLSPERYIAYRYSREVAEKATKALPSSFTEKLSCYINPFTLLRLLKLKSKLSNFENSRVEHNEEFINNELVRRAELFNDISGFPLDEQQRRAVIADEDNSLVIAGAGSGKTLTIVGKVKYLLSALDVSADSILPISFTNKSAKSLQEKINIPGVRPQTFHAFGLTVLQSVEHRKPNIYDGSDINKLMRSFIEHLSKDQSYLSLLNSFFLNYIKVPKSQFEFDSHGDYIQYMKDQNFTTYKRVQIPFHGRETYRNETVKSIEECIIANFLIFNRIEYEYEKQYDFPYSQFGRKKSYKPDFTLLVGDEKIYLEHLGMDRNGNVPKFFAGPNETHSEATRRYARMLEWKKRTHQSNHTKLIETYSYQFSDGTLVDELRASLTNAGVPLNPMSDEEVWQVIQEAGKDQVDAFIELCQTFLSLLKSNGYSIRKAHELSSEQENDFLKERATIFLDLFEPIYEMYEDNLHQNGEIDFNDMITKATSYIYDGDYYCPLKYVIIDEFQDLSFGRYRILQAIRKQNPDVKFYCVGDDWQSIFRFTGSDIALFRDFEDYFGYTYTSRIETTYRFNDPLISMSSEFILKNPNQSLKQLRAPDGTPETHHTILESEGSDDDTQAVIDAINRMVEHGLTPESEVYIIGRYNFDIKRIWNRNKEFVINFTTGLIKYKFLQGSFTGQTINIQFVTAHKSKGLEADFTIIINCNSGKYGFPSGKADDPILNILLSSADQFENGEERRLFYVAMTRAKRHVVFIADRYRKSKFIKELQDEHGSRELKCPSCQNGELILRSGKANGRSFKFYGCSNFAYGCQYSKAYKPEEDKQVPKQPQADNESTPIVSQPRFPSKTERPSPISASSSRLTLSQQNKLTYFVSSPKLYVSSEKARAKVNDLIAITSKFSTEEASKFEEAYKVWLANLPTKSKVS